MTPQEQLNTVWPFPVEKPLEGPKKVPVITGARGSDSVAATPAGANGPQSTSLPIDWGNVTVKGGVTTVTIPKATDSTIAVLDERAKNYGPFIDMATLTQSFKQILHTAPSWKTMKADQQESLEMIVHKIARILNGRPDYADSWVDIAGYARLVSERLEKGIIR